MGDRLGSMRAAVAALTQRADIRIDPVDGVASLYEATPVGGPPGQPMFLNSAVAIHTRRTPLALLEIALAIEASLGRVRREPWGARVIDLDLLLYDNLIMADAQLTLPHPRMHKRRFVLEPLAEIAGDVIHPVLGRAVADLARERRSESSPDETVAWVAGPDWPFDAPEAT